MTRGTSCSLAVLTMLTLVPRSPGWGLDGHKMIARLAVQSLPGNMPKFFRHSRPQLEFLNAEPDTWRDRQEAVLSSGLLEGHDGDHIFKFEHYSPPVLPPDRQAFLDTLHREGIRPRLVGMLPYRSLELFQRMRVTFRRWRVEKDPKIRRFLEARILDDGGILGHYIGDSAMPLHMSINRNGWEEPENPRDYTRDKTLHSRFESAYVKARVLEKDVRPKIRPLEIVQRDPLAFVYAHMRLSFEQVRPLYELEKIEPFSPANQRPEARDFTAARLADAAATLRDLWYTAWATSAP